MENVLAGKRDSNVLDELFSGNLNAINSEISLSAKRNTEKSLYSKVKYLERTGSSGFTLNNELSDKKVYKIACALALAIDKNSPVEIKHIKAEYGDTKEFAKAKDFLNKQCKIVWDVSTSKSKKMNVPYVALKTLGITNKPALSFYLNNSIAYFEKDNGSTTAKIISSVLSNPNLGYNENDIFEYLKSVYKQKRCHYNYETMNFMAQKLDYNLYKLSAITSDKSIMKKIFMNLPLLIKVKVIITTLIQVAKEWKNA
jgi:hypothetical protein